jgi:hypothetical protein
MVMLEYEVTHFIFLFFWFVFSSPIVIQAIHRERLLVRVPVRVPEHILSLY